MLSLFMIWPAIGKRLLSPQRQAAPFAAEREAAYRAHKAASRRGDTRAMNAASASLQAITHAQLRAEVGR